MSNQTEQEMKLRACIAELERDKARMDWLEAHARAQHSNFVSIAEIGRYYNGFPGSFRAAIDAAMEGKP